MKVPGEIKGCIAFAGCKMADGTYKMAGTVFFVFLWVGSEMVPYIVTARHVLEGICNLGLEDVYLRINLKNGMSKWVQTKISDWVFPGDKSIDIAVLPDTLEEEGLDHMHFSMEAVMTERRINQFEIDVGDEVFITGLFKHHHGKDRNIPIVRVGNIAAFREERIQVHNHVMDGYLIEARSIGGLSGSPVFVHLGSERGLSGRPNSSARKPVYYLMGIIHGHYDSKISEIDILISDGVDAETHRVNTGIAIVTPVSKLVKLLDQLHPDKFYGLNEGVVEGQKD